MNKINTINGILMASQDELNEHVENGTAHVTEEERTVWNTQASVNAKGIVIATQGDLDEHAGNKAIHLTEEERTAWNAKADTSNLVSKVDVETFNAHKGDDAIHITEKDRNSWNGKQDKLTDDEGNMTLAGGLTATSGTITGQLVVNNPAGNLGNGAHNQIHGITWFYQQSEFRNGVIIRGNTFVESGILNINKAASINCNGPATYGATINANGGVNIPLSVAPTTPTSGVNRLCSLGMAAVTDAFSPQSFLSSFTLYGNSFAVKQTVPGVFWELKKTAAANGTVQVNLINPFLGVSNYSGWRGFVLPCSCTRDSACKLTFLLGSSKATLKKSTEADLDMFTLSPVVGETNHFVHFIDVTFYATDNGSSTPPGFPVRVRELIYNRTDAKWIVHETNSVIPSFSAYVNVNMFLAYQQADLSSSTPAGLWIGSNSIDKNRLLRIADLHAITDTFEFMGVNSLYWDCQGGSSFIYLGSMRQMTAPGENQQNGAYYAFKSLETNLIQSMSTTDFTPYE